MRGLRRVSRMNTLYSWVLWAGILWGAAIIARGWHGERCDGIYDYEHVCGNENGTLNEGGGGAW